MYKSVDIVMLYLVAVKIKYYILIVKKRSKDSKM